MIRSFANRGTEDVFNGVDSKAARKVCPPDVVARAQEKLDWLDSVISLQALKSVGNALEELRKERKGQWAFRINQRYRICFRWVDGDAHDVEITDYH
jgi:proteic killer suppression protein